MSQVVAQLLAELNPDVIGNARVANFQNLLQTGVYSLHALIVVIPSSLTSSMAI